MSSEILFVFIEGMRKRTGEIMDSISF